MAALPSSLGNVAFINTILTQLSNLIPALPTSQQNGASTFGVLPSKIFPALLTGSKGTPWGTRTALKTNAYEDPPTTGVTRYYNLELSEQTLAPDGTNLSMIVINGQFPGPTLEANWGDTFHITVKNSLNEGTSLHWHGLRQTKTPWYDGVPAVSMCPIAPGQTFTYVFQADLYGTSWYHSHYSAQYSGGALGPMVIYGPTDNFPSGLSASNTIDLGPILVMDWYHTDWHALVAQDVSPSTAPGSPIVADNALIQGKMNTDCGAGSTNCTTNAGLAKFNFQTGKTHRMRFVNTGAQSFSLITLDSHKMVVVANDYVPITPYTVDYVILAVGQRTDVLVTANQFAGAYWLRVRNPPLCAPSNQGNALAAVYYPGVDTNSVPLSLPWLDWLFPTLLNCNNDALTNTVPSYPITLPAPDVTTTLTISVGSNSTGNPKYYVNGSSFFADFNKPLLNEINNGNLNFPSSWNVYNFQTANNIRIVWQNTVAFPHPMHIHGQNMLVVDVGAGTYDGSSTVRPSNPMRRDTQTLPPNGYLVTQLISDNPGAWPFHCHIAWHLSQGLYINVVQRPDEIPNSYIGSVLPQTCNAWNSFSSSNYVDEIDDGL